MRQTALFLLFLALAAPGYPQQKDQQQQNTVDKHCEMNQRGDQKMGFAQDKTTHHFLLYPDGGAIDVDSNTPEDTKSRDQIRAHLSHIAEMFAAGNFEAPMFIHDTVPPGVTTMTRLHEQIGYRYEETPAGGRVRITSKSAPAVDAVHAFLLFQIADHRTGDSPAVTKDETASHPTN